MKKIILSAIISVPLLAQSGNFIEVGFGSGKTTDNFHSDSKQITTSYSASDSFNKTIPYLQFAYTNANFTFKTIEDNILLGYTNTKLTMGIFTSLSNSMNSAWENPYILNVNKKETKVSKNGLYLEYSFIKNKNYASKIKYTYTKVDIDKDTSIASLQRDANKHKIMIDNRYKNNILYNFSYAINDSKGEANSFKNYGLGIGYIKDIGENVNVVLLANVEKTSYDKQNQILNKKIETTKKEFVVVTTWNNPFDFKDKYLKLIYKNTTENANHDFYDKKQQLAILSVGFKF